MAALALTTGELVYIQIIKIRKVHPQMYATHSMWIRVERTKRVVSMTEESLHIWWPGQYSPTASSSTPKDIYFIEIEL